MRIGILTHHYVSNFGAYLQAWCLREAIASLRPGDTVEIIDFVLPKHKIINTGGMLRFDPKRETGKSWLEKVKVMSTFRREQKKLPMTRRVYSAKAICALGLDAIVVGSDEVWNYTDARSFSPVKFGVGLETQKMIAYSPSVGIVSDFDNMPASLIEGLKGFRSLSARDDLTAQMLTQKVGKPFTRTLDPVLIQPLPSGLTQRVKRLISKPYALMYHFGLGYEQQKQLVYPALKQRGLTILGAGEYNIGYDECSVDLTPFEMAELFRHAQIVFTGTFHGVVLSVVGGTPFVVCPNNPTRQRKLGSLLSELGLTDRLIAPAQFDLEEAWNKTLDMDKVAQTLAPKREASLGYLSGAFTSNL